MHRVRHVLILMLVAVSALWAPADTPLPQPLGWFSFRSVFVQYTGIVATVAMSVALLLALRPRWIKRRLDGLDNRTFTPSPATMIMLPARIQCDASATGKATQVIAPRPFLLVHPVRAGRFAFTHLSPYSAAQAAQKGGHHGPLPTPGPRLVIECTSFKVNKFLHYFSCSEAPAR